VSKLNNIEQRNVALAPLDSTNVVAMEVRQFGEPLLCEAAFSAQLAQPFPELVSWDVVRRHTSSFADAHYESTHDECDILTR